MRGVEDVAYMALVVQGLHIQASLTSSLDNLSLLTRHCSNFESSLLAVDRQRMGY